MSNAVKRRRPDGADLVPLTGSFEWVSGELQRLVEDRLIFAAQQRVEFLPSGDVRVWVRLREHHRQARPEPARMSTAELACVTAVALVLAGGLVTAVVVVAVAIGAHMQEIVALIALVLIVGVVGAVKVLPAIFGRR